MSEQQSGLIQCLETVAGGGEITLEQIKRGGDWLDDDPRAKWFQYAYVELQQFAFDEDIRSHDKAYDERKRAHLKWVLSELTCNKR